MTSATNAINCMAELARLGIEYQALSDSEVKLRCPSHDDQTPSATLNVEKGVWQCHTAGCEARGDIVSLLALHMRVSRATMLVELGRRYDLGNSKRIAPEVVERFHARLHEAGPLLAELRRRGVTDEMMRAARLGFHEGRITIPVYDATGACVNVRRYLPGAPTAEKMLNTRGYGGARLYRAETLGKAERVWVCGGEMKALVVGSLLGSHGVAAVSGTAGEGQWKPEWTSALAGRDVWVCMDVDDPGRAAAREVSRALLGTARSVRVISLPLDLARYPKGDVNDYVGQEGAGASDLLALMETAESVERPRLAREEEPDVEPRGVKLVDATKPENVGVPLSMECVISAMDTTPYLVPAVVKVECTRDQPGCSLCPIKIEQLEPDTGFVEARVPASSGAILSMVGSGKKTQREALREALQIPPCDVVMFHVTKHHRVTDVRLAPQLTLTSEGGNNIVQPAYAVGERVDLNVPYRARARVYPHPGTQQATLVVNKMDESIDSLSTFVPTADQLHEMRTFRPESWDLDAVEGRLSEIYDDLEANVTRIFERRDLHRILDMTWHSPLAFRFDDKVTNGWMNVLVVGDSSQGKTETSVRMMEHYGLGERVDCKNASAAGLIGGLQQLGTKWFVTWGVIPTHDRRLVILEEVKGASPEILARMTDMRSSGIAEIPKIERRRAHARTRLAFLSNPRSSRPVSSYNFGIETLHELIGSLEDLRRFDAALVVSATAIDAERMAELSTRRPVVDHRFTSDLCRTLILWAWTLPAESVRFEVEATSYILKATNELCGEFTESVPLIDRGTTRLKLARMAAATAARTYSRDDETGELLVRRAHAESVVRWIRRVYSSKEMGYADYTLARKAMTTIVDAEAVSKYLMASKHCDDVPRQLLYTDQITRSDIQDFFEVNQDDAQGVISFLVRKCALRRGHRSVYFKTPAFIDLLKSMVEKPQPPLSFDKEEF